MNITTPQPECTSTEAERPLVVVIQKFPMDFSEYRGSRAQLEDEILFPANFAWPDGKQRVDWVDSQFRFSLIRARPDDLKGPMKLWIDGDYWKLRWERKLQPSWELRAINKKSEELLHEIYRQSPEGKRARGELSARYWKSQDNQEFQAFMSAYVLQGKRPGRPRKAKPSQGASA